jgi:hypothetical protein
MASIPYGRNNLGTPATIGGEEMRNTQGMHTDHREVKQRRDRARPRAAHVARLWGDLSYGQRCIAAQRIGAVSFLAAINRHSWRVVSLQPKREPDVPDPETVAYNQKTPDALLRLYPAGGEQ